VERRPERDRDAAFRLVVDFLAAVFRFAVDFFAAVFRLGAAFRLAVDFFADVFRFAVDFLAAVFRFAVDFFRVVAAFFAAVFRFAVDFFRVVAAFFAAVFRFAVDFFRVVEAFFAAVFRFAVDFFAAAFRFGAAFFLAPDFLAVDFFFAVDFFRAPEERELLEERDDDRVVAGTATVRSASELSASAAGSFHEPALDVSDASPVPLQSSWVMYDLLSWIARARSLPRQFLTCNADGMTSAARCKKGKQALDANDGALSVALHAHCEQRLRRRSVDAAGTFNRHHHLRTATHAPRQRERASVELTCALHRRVRNPRLVRLAARQLRKANREHRLSRRSDDELAARTTNRNVT
jgi:hypothetical protein